MHKNKKLFTYISLIVTSRLIVPTTNSYKKCPKLCTFAETCSSVVLLQRSQALEIPKAITSYRIFSNLMGTFFRVLEG